MAGGHVIAQDIDSTAIPSILTLEQVIRQGQDHSISALYAETNKEGKYWAFRAFQAQYKPSVYLQGELPNFNRTNEPVTQPDGSIEFRPVSQNLSNLGLRAEQSIGYTNTVFFLESRLQRFDNFENNTVRYSGNPAIIGIQQSLFQFNPLKWDKTIQPLVYEESRREYVEQLEDISVQSTQLFFNLLLAQVNMVVAKNNMANNDTIYQLSQGRYNLGKIAENELLKLELNLMNSRQAVAQAELDLETSTLELRSYTGLIGSEPLSLVLPNDLPTFEVDEEVAVNQALANRAEAVAFERSLKEAEREVASARSQRFSMNLYATYGLTNQADELTGVYQQPENQQQVRLSLRVPILDWGRSKSSIKTSEAYLKLQQYTVQQDRINFRQEVYTRVKTFEMRRNQVKITEVANDIANRSYDIAKQRYLIGKISVNDLSIAMQEKDDARQRYIENLRNFWTDFYNLRRLTLYDFSTNQPLYKQTEK